MRMSPTESRSDAGSAAVELVVLTPVLFLLALMALAFGRVSEARQQVVEAARAGAEAAAVLPDAQIAQTGAAQLAVSDVVDQTHVCSGANVFVDVSHFAPGGSVTVDVACSVDLSDLSVPGVPGSTTVHASATAPIDPYRAVQ
jgi:Flp pilus assembly protein TadG